MVQYSACIIIEADQKACPSSSNSPLDTWTSARDMKISPPPSLQTLPVAKRTCRPGLEAPIKAPSTARLHLQPWRLFEASQKSCPVSCFHRPTRQPGPVHSVSMPPLTWVFRACRASTRATWSRTCNNMLNNKVDLWLKVVWYQVHLCCCGQSMTSTQSNSWKGPKVLRGDFSAGWRNLQGHDWKEQLTWSEPECWMIYHSDALRVIMCVKKSISDVVLVCAWDMFTLSLIYLLKLLAHPLK